MKTVGAIIGILLVLLGLGGLLYEITITGEFSLGEAILTLACVTVGVMILWRRFR